MSCAEVNNRSGRKSRFVGVKHAVRYTANYDPQDSSAIKIGYTVGILALLQLFELIVTPDLPLRVCLGTGCANAFEMREKSRTRGIKLEKSRLRRAHRNEGKSETGRGSGGTHASTKTCPRNLSCIFAILLVKVSSSDHSCRAIARFGCRKTCDLSAEKIQQSLMFL